MPHSATPLLSTKLHVVRPQPDIIVRERLSQRTDEIARRRLILISAPAGFGKTTLISSWIEEHSFPTAWLSLDRSDNELVRFLRYLVASLRTIHPEVGSGVESALAMAPVPAIETMLTSLVNELALIEEHFLLVFDDFHAIESDAVHSAVLFLLEHGPQQLHVVITTRTDPSFPLSRFRVRGQLLELRASDLRFTGDEAGALFNGSLALGLTPKQIATLESKTEGWIAGLQMAALSVQGREDVDGFIEAFAGTDRYVLDYLVEEVLNRQTPELTHAMLQLSILESFNASLVEAVTGIGNGAELIDILEHANLFLVSLDNRREWFRYHRLFADLLAHHHARRYPDEIAELHRRACSWSRANGRIDLAVEHARCSGDIDLLLEILEDHCLWLLAARNSYELREDELLKMIPTDRIRSNPRVALVLAAALDLHDDSTRLGEIVRMIDESLVDALDPALASELRANIGYFRALVALNEAEPSRGFDECEVALKQITLSKELGSATITLSREHLLALQGLTLSRQGKWERAEYVWEEVLASSRRSGNITLAVSMLHNLALWEINRARPTACWARCEEILRLKETADASMRVSNTFQVDVAHAHQKMAVVLFDRHDLEGAKRLIDIAIDLYPSGLSYQLTPTLKTAIDIADARGCADEAYQLMERWESLAIPAQGAAHTTIGLAVRAFLDLRNGRLELVERWVDLVFGSASESLPTRTFLMNVFEETTYVRYLLRSGRAADALARIAPLVEQLREKALQRTLLDAQVLHALALRATGNEDASMDALGSALKLASPERIVRPFLVDGHDTLRLVRAWRKQATAVDPIVKRLIDMIESAHAADPMHGVPMETTVVVSGGLLEPLTTRETEILNLMAAGYSNQKIAGKLYLSVNTIKTHASNLFSKLGASSRVEAITRAREERLL